MTHIGDMLRTHPRRGSMPVAEVQQTIDAISDCAQSCNSCADACLGEQSVQDLVRCIRLNTDCADICVTTAAILMRLTEPDETIIRKQLESCMEACGRCAQECERHAQHHEHCRLCAEACRRCESACRAALQGMQAGAQARR